MTHTPEDVLKFWFEDIKPEQWWTKDLAFDQVVKKRFGELHAKGAKCELWRWRESARGRLAEIIVLDQFSRNMFRDDPRPFATDSLALALAQEAVKVGVDRDLAVPQRSFLYMPYMHSESILIHEEALKLFSAKGMESNLDFERRHLEILKRFGRYPHRNKILGRSSTDEEMAFLKTPGSSF